jgi:uncharacterized protein YndB with AHSA1/START domain
MKPLIIERIFEASTARVWSAISSRDEMKKWYFDLMEFRPEVGFEFKFAVEHEGVNYVHLCKVTEAVTGRKLAYTWRYEGDPGDSLVTFELFAEGDKTRVKLTHEGLESFPPVAAYARGNFEAGWTDIIGSSLKKHLESEA